MKPGIEIPPGRLAVMILVGLGMWAVIFLGIRILVS